MCIHTFPSYRTTQTYSSVYYIYELYMFPLVYITPFVLHSLILSQ